PTTHCFSSIPAVTANQFHKLARAEIFFDYPFGRARDSDQALFGFGSDGENESSAGGQLIDEGFRLVGGGGGDQDCAVRSDFVPAVCAVEAFDRGVVNTQSPQTRLRLARKFGDAFESEDLARDGGEHGGLIARSGADFERSVLFGHFQQFGLARDDVRLRDRLIEFYGKSMVVIGVRSQSFGHEEMTGDAFHRGQYAFVFDVVMTP